MQNISRQEILQLFTHDDIVRHARKRISRPSTHSFAEIENLLQTEWQSFGRRRGLYCNMDAIRDAFDSGYMHTLSLADTLDEQQSAYMRRHGYVLSDSKTLPAFCITNDNGDVVYLWTSPPMRYFGFARQFILQLNINHAIGVLPETVSFFKKMDVPVESIASP